MEVIKYVTIAIMVLLVGCSAPTPDEITPNSSAGDSQVCSGDSAMLSSYIVQFKDGTIQRVDEYSRDKFVKGFVTKNFKQIKRIEWNRKIHVNFKTKSLVPLISEYWGNENIKSDILWDAGYFGQGIKVAVVDTGVDVGHILLKDNIWKNPGEMGSGKESNGIDDDGNGFIDDVNGFNFVELNSNVHDDVGHGTHVAGIIASQHNDTEASNNKMQGVAPQAKIIPVKFLSKTGGSLSDAILAVDYAVKMGANVINASWGGTGPQNCSLVLQDLIRSLEDKNILFVAAAGNEKTDIDYVPVFPASYNLRPQITVGSIAKGLGMASHSNFGVSSVHVFAPGSDIVSTLPNNQLGSATGTSMATPFVSGVVALLLSHNSTLDIMDLKNALFTNTAIYPNSDTYEWLNYKNSTRGRVTLESYFK